MRARWRRFASAREILKGISGQNTRAHDELSAKKEERDKLERNDDSGGKTQSD
jgi:hypothetical protein